MNTRSSLSTFAAIGFLTAIPATLTLPSASAFAAVAVEDFHAQAHTKLAALQAEGQPATGENALPLLRSVGQRIRDIQAAVMNVGGKRADGAAAAPDFQGLGMLADPKADAADVDLARKALAKIESEGLFAPITKIAAAPRFVRDAETGLLLNMEMPELGAARAIARLNVGRASLALDAGNTADFAARMDELLAIGAKTGQSPTMISGLVGVAVQSLAMDTIRRAIATGRLTEPDLAALAASLDKHAMPDASKAIRGEQLLAEDAMEFVYVGGPAAMKQLQDMGKSGKTGTGLVLDRAKPAIAPTAALGPGMPDFKAQMKLTAEYYSNLIRLAGLNAKARRDAPMPAELAATVEKNLLLGMLTPAIDRALTSRDQFNADRAGTRVIIALERHKLKNGSYPESLKALVPALIGEVPTDPFTGAALGYQGPKQGPFEGRHKFVVFAAGADCKNDDGNVDYKNRLIALQTKGRGTDLLLSDAEPRAGQK
jgi:hypothetical protein